MPIRYGPQNPPSAPAELIIAIPPAAAVPRSIVVGSAQNGPRQPQAPAAASESEAVASNGFTSHALNPKPTIAASRLAARKMRNDQHDNRCNCPWDGCQQNHAAC